MEKYILTIDLGTTNIKAGVYNPDMKEISICSFKVKYLNQNGFVEFNPRDYWKLCKKGIDSVINKSKINPKNVISISITGQAESFVLLDDNLESLRNGISWMDNRSKQECEILKKNFKREEGYNITGQPDILTTWPITKILWIKRNEEEIFKKVYKILLLKDFILFKLTGKFFAEYTVYNFSYYLDIIKKEYWNDILDFVGIKREQLPEFIEPGEDAGTVTEEIIKEFNFSHDISVNVGALDHFAGMIGTGNIKEGIVSETTGTILAIATMVNYPMMNKYHFPCHYNAIKDTYVLLPTGEGGGICLEWFKKIFSYHKDFEYLNKEIEKKIYLKNEITFLPYITGVSAPEYNPNALGVFYGIKIYHDKIDFARAIMEGITYLLKKNIEIFNRLDINVNNIISLGGGAKSEVWNQIKADITGKDILIPEYEEASSLGAAILAGVKCGFYKSIDEAVEKCVRIKKSYNPGDKNNYEIGYKKFLDIYEKLDPIFNS